MYTIFSDRGSIFTCHSNRRNRRFFARTRHHFVATFSSKFTLGLCEENVPEYNIHNDLGRSVPTVFAYQRIFSSTYSSVLSDSPANTEASGKDCLENCKYTSPKHFVNHTIEYGGRNCPHLNRKVEQPLTEYEYTPQIFGSFNKQASEQST